MAVAPEAASPVRDVSPSAAEGEDAGLYGEEQKKLSFDNIVQSMITPYVGRELQPVLFNSGLDWCPPAERSRYVVAQGLFMQLPAYEAAAKSCELHYEQAFLELLMLCAMPSREVVLLKELLKNDYCEFLEKTLAVQKRTLCALHVTAQKLWPRVCAIVRYRLCKPVKVTTYDDLLVQWYALFYQDLATPSGEYPGYKDAGLSYEAALRLTRIVTGIVAAVLLGIKSVDAEAFVGCSLPYVSAHPDDRLELVAALGKYDRLKKKIRFNGVVLHLQPEPPAAPSEAKVPAKSDNVGGAIRALLSRRRL